MDDGSCPSEQGANVSHISGARSTRLDSGHRADMRIEQNGGSDTNGLATSLPCCDDEVYSADQSEALRHTPTNHDFCALSRLNSPAPMLDRSRYVNRRPELPNNCRKI